MKKKSSFFAVKALIILAFGISGFACYKGNAQSITGKWKMTAAKETVTDKASGKTQDLSAQMGDITKMIEQIIEFHADKTYFTSNTMVGAKSGIRANGTYIVSGNQLKLQPGKSNVPVSNTKYSNPVSNKLPNTMVIVSQTGSTLILHYSAETTDNGKTFTVDITDTFTKQ
jgi:hypothetical protein